MTYGVINSENIIANIISADESTPISSDMIRVDNITPEPGIGWTYENGKFTPPPSPPPPPPPPPQTVFTKFGFRSRFTFSELVAVDNFADNSTLTADQKAALTTITKSFDAAQEIDITNQATIQGVNYLATCGLITAERAAQILDPAFPVK